MARVSIYQCLNHSGVNICIAPDDAEEDLDDDNADADDDININEVLGMFLGQTSDFTKHSDVGRYPDTGASSSGQGAPTIRSE